MKLTKEYGWEKDTYGVRLIKKDWQREYIEAIFEIAKNNNKDTINLADSIYSDIVRQKPRLPFSLYKFYRPTINNIFDVFNKRIYLANPNDFNDIFDSKLGINEALFKKQFILNTIKRNIGILNFLTEDLFRVLKSSPIGNCENSFENLFRKTKYASSDEAQMYFYKISKEAKIKFNEQKKQFDEYIKTHLKRIACFISGEQDNICSQTAMWAHYADNGKGFCVEYDMDKIQNLEYYIGKVYNANTSLEINVAKQYLEKIQCCLLPVIYSSKRPNLQETFFNNLHNKKYQINIEKAQLLSCINKSVSWSKEKEFRLVLNADDYDLYDNKLFFPFIKAVYFGYNMESSIKKEFYEFVKKEKIENNRVIEIYHCAQGYNKYTLETEYYWNDNTLTNDLYNIISKNLMGLLSDIKEWEMSEPSLEELEELRQIEIDKILNREC